MSEAVREGVRTGVVELDDADAIIIATQVTQDFLTQVGLTGVVVNAQMQQINGGFTDVLNVSATLNYVPAAFSTFLQPFPINSSAWMRQEGQ